MSPAPTLELYALPPSHPCMTVVAAMRHKGLDFTRKDLHPATFNDEMEALFGAGNRTVPGLLVGDQPVHGSRAILAHLETLRPEPALFPSAIADAVRDAEHWGDTELQDLGRRLPFGALHFRPEALGSFGGAGPLDPAGTDFAMKYIHGTWKYHGITAQRLAEDLAGLPAKLDRVAEFAAAGVIGGDEPTAADLQIGATLRVLLTVRDLGPLLDDHVGARIAMRWFPEYAGEVPAGAYPAGWVPAG